MHVSWGKLAGPSGKGTNAAGEYYQHKGGGSELLSLLVKPEFLAFRNGGFTNQYEVRNQHWTFITKP